MPWFHKEDDAVILQLQIQPGARRNGFAGLHGHRLKLKLHAPPVDGKANAELIDFISDSFGTTKSAVTIIQGALGRSKTIRVANATQVPAALHALGLRLLD
jgi:uncharacterized protein (TIGR00251 family)